MRIATEPVAPSRVRDLLARHILTDGMEIVLDPHASQGSWLVDARSGRRYLDLYTFVGSSPLGFNPTGLADDSDFLADLGKVATNKPANSDLYTPAFASFVDTFFRVVGDPALPHLFFVEGGTLAVENALKAAFDWKSRTNEIAGRSPDCGTKVLHLTKAFHGRGGYTLSLTNTQPIKTARFPKFDWPRIPVPAVRFPEEQYTADVALAEGEALRAAEEAFERNPHEIACFIAEPIQGDGGDNHMRAEFFRAMRELCDSHEALFIFDEVQSGMGITGTAWAYQQLDVVPDVVAFAKKAQVGGIMAGKRFDEITDNVFTVPSRINSTWGGNLVDMVRCQRVLEIIEHRELFQNARDTGAWLLEQLRELSEVFPTLVANARGRGLMCAVDLPSPEQRNAVLAQLRERGVLMIGSGERSLRFRPALTANASELSLGIDALHDTLSSL